MDAAIEKAKADAIEEYKKAQAEKERKASLTPEELKAEEDAEKAGKTFAQNVGDGVGKGIKNIKGSGGWKEALLKKKEGETKPFKIANLEIRIESCEETIEKLKSKLA